MLYDSEHIIIYSIIQLFWIYAYKLISIFNKYFKLLKKLKLFYEI